SHAHRRVPDRGYGRWAGAQRPGPGAAGVLSDHRRDAARVVRGVALTAEVMFAAGVRRVLLPFDGAPEAHDLAEVRSLLSRPTHQTSSATARRSSTTATAVTGPTTSHASCGTTCSASNSAPTSCCSAGPTSSSPGHA